MLRRSGLYKRVRKQMLREANHDSYEDSLCSTGAKGGVGKSTLALLMVEALCGAKPPSSDAPHPYEGVSSPSQNRYMLVPNPLTRQGYMKTQSQGRTLRRRY